MLGKGTGDSELERMAQQEWMMCVSVCVFVSVLMHCSVPVSLQHGV